MPQLYHANYATFELPERLLDKSVHMFTLNDHGPSDFNIVISQAETQAGEQLEEFGSRLVAELGRSLPRFELRSMTNRLLGGSPAVELVYSWRKDGNFMHQRQVITLTHGAGEDSVQAILIAATCLKPFTDEWNCMFDQMLASFTLRRPLAGAVPMPIAAPAPVEHPPITNPSGLPLVFTYSERRRMLVVHPDQEHACRKTDAREVEQDAWEFYDADGEPLTASFAISNASTLWGKPSEYQLAPSGQPHAPRLRDRLDHVAVLHTTDAAPKLATVADIRQHLARAIISQTG
ncbi:DcrB-related protein [Massilia sp. PAMC28688]|uniref:DcrB-related protein n=1 Tax=Massilia sp. PAMC28688 TaxID=2861283 RepID=UPI001C637E4D|nr:DcrB-related protein [Massilia sp. PAMC28688]QYF95825.1 DcrB-related protein [Massilia sp. PAMC28688]